MRLQIKRVDGGYEATVMPSHGDDVRWVTATAMSQRALIDSLFDLGFHQQDIGDAFYEADAAWLDRPLDEEAHRKGV